MQAQSNGSDHHVRTITGFESDASFSENRAHNIIYASQGNLEKSTLKNPDGQPVGTLGRKAEDSTAHGHDDYFVLSLLMESSTRGFIPDYCPIRSARSCYWMPPDMFATNQHYLTHPALQHTHPVPENTFALDGEKQQYSHDWTMPDNSPGHSQDSGISYLTNSLGGPETSLWTFQSPVARSTIGRRSLSESVGIQNISNYDGSRDTERTAFECSREECHGKRFARQSELKRHEDRHSRPFVCPVSSCNKKDFADRGSLQRHSREVHKSAKYFCPVVQCERHKRGFGRKYNLIGHNRRVHRGTALDLMSPVSEDAYGNSFEQDDDAIQSGEDGIEGLGDEDDDYDEPPEGLSSPIVSGRAEELKQKLRRLRATKNEHDMAGEKLTKEIKTVERLLLDVICNEA